MAGAKDGGAVVRGIPASHPGETLKEIVLPGLKAEHGLGVTDVVKRLGIGRQTLYDVLEQRRPVTPQMALRLARLCGGPPAEHWLAMQAAWDLERAREDLGSELEAIDPVGGAQAA